MHPSPLRIRYTNFPSFKKPRRTNLRLERRRRQEKGAAAPVPPLPSLKRGGRKGGKWKGTFFRRGKEQKFVFNSSSFDVVAQGGKEG